MRKTITVAVFSVIFAASVFALPEEPHRIFGEVTNSDTGEELESDIAVEYDGENVKAFKSGEDGYYDVEIPNGEYEGEELDIILEGEEVESFIFEGLGSSEINLEHSEESEDNGDEEQEDDEQEEDNGESEDSQEDSGDGGSGPELGGAMPSEDEDLEDDSEGEQNETDTELDDEDSVEESETEEESFFEEDLGQVEDGEEVRLDTSEEGYSTKALSFSSTGSQESGHITVNQLEADESDEITAELDSLPDAETLSYTEVETDIETENATFEFEIDQRDLEQREASPEQVVKQKYHEEGWNNLETELVDQTEESYIFEAYSPEGFSIFATTLQEQETQTEDLITGEFFSEQTNGLTVILSLVIVVIGVYIVREM